MPAEPGGMEVRAVYYDYEVELPTGLWHLGYRTLKMRTSVQARGYDNGEGKFIVSAIMRTLGHEVDPEDWNGFHAGGGNVQSGGSGGGRKL